jgi:hypothetical protein
MNIHPRHKVSNLCDRKIAAAASLVNSATRSGKTRSLLRSLAWACSGCFWAAAAGRRFSATLRDRC